MCLCWGLCSNKWGNLRNYYPVRNQRNFAPRTMCLSDRLQPNSNWYLPENLPSQQHRQRVWTMRLHAKFRSTRRRQLREGQNLPSQQHPPERSLCLHRWLRTLLRRQRDVLCKMSRWSVLGIKFKNLLNNLCHELNLQQYSSKMLM